MTRLLLIRHGETDYNSNRRYCGFDNPPLNGCGISQSENLAKQVKDFDVASVYSSDLLRAIQTAEILFPGYQLKTTPNFREFNFGVFEGLNYAEIMNKYSGLYHDWLADPLRVSIPKGEKFTDFKNRVESTLFLAIFLNRNKVIALVSHSGPIRLILCRVLGCGFKKFWEFNHDNAAFSIIDISTPRAINLKRSRRINYRYTVKAVSLNNSAFDRTKKGVV